MRTKQGGNIGTATARAKCKQRREPYWVPIVRGSALGYRKGSTGGTWIARVRRDDGKQTYHALGAADDLNDGNGLTYEAALREARKVFKAPAAAKLTVRQAIENYLAHLKAHKGESARKDAENKLNVYVLGIVRRGPARIPRAHQLGDFDVNRLTLTQLQKWQAALVKVDPDDEDAERRSKDSANRVASSFKAALNHAFADEKNDIPSDKAWRALKAFKGVDEAREDHFTEAEVLTLIEAAAEQEPQFADVIEAVFHTGARPPHEIAAFDVRHFDARRSQITIPEGKTGSRITTLAPEGVAFFKRLTDGKKPRDVLLPRPDGTRWGKSHQHRRMKEALRAAKLPETAGLYTVRHTYISRALERGMELTTVAANVGTSVRMIEKNYRKFIAQRRRDHIAATAPQLRIVKAA